MSASLSLHRQRHSTSYSSCAATRTAAAAPSGAGQQGSQHLPLLVRASRSAARRALLLALTLGLLSAASGSPGDQSFAFRRCHSQCLRTGCTSLPTPSVPGRRVRTGTRKQCSPLCVTPSNTTDSSASIDGSGQAVPLALKLWRWNCAADCTYLCMWRVEASRAFDSAGSSRKLPVWKYYGKWPFVRWAGMQEPASVLFSLANLAAHALCLLRFVRLRRGLAAAAGQRGTGTVAPITRSTRSTRSSTGSDSAGASKESGYPYAWLWQGYMLLSINAWLWSAVFHGRDTRLTERLDYFAAALLIFFNLFLCIVRTARLRAPLALAAVAAPLLAFLAAHFRFMLVVLFDYGYHVKVCIAAGTAQSLLWLGWALAARPPHPGRRYLLGFIAAVNACMLLEVLDFPPLLHTLDAHSLWHAATAPLVLLFYRFIEADVTTHTAAADAKTD